MLLAKDCSQARQGHSGLDCDRHIGGWVIDQPIDRRGVEDHSGRAGDTAVVDRGSAALRVDGVSGGHSLPNALAERFDIFGPIRGQGKPVITENPASRGIRPRCQGVQCGCSELVSVGAG